ncbi:DNA cytosine methyltransferase [Phenylobacterium sp.]|uniref:DNA cytosine methyltransferase n=1 Tax=Phenylobacterium sp. TaxID=1871053 RepID=UPI00273092C8|nr:DNA cytosine methyltransferase [Phenylobacterium sp.]MDP1617742.1 DNA cytosine methyltransferase [Phenylobacterium sp.]MDP1989373.1 DNA cytosine methyltransferase [Phenylobacterium sp.]
MIPVVDLFAGAGGFGIASRIIGADLRLSVEIDQWACETLRLNETDDRHVIHEGSVVDMTGDSLRQMAGLASSDPLVVVGGAPCQPFSKNAYWTDPGEDSRLRLAFYRGDQAAYQRPPSITEPRPDDRRNLLLEFARLTIEAKADGFVLENVPSIFHPRNRQTLQVFIDTLKEAGMQISVFKGNSAQFGVPQKRERIFILGARPRAPEAPEITHAEEPSIFLNRFVTVGDAIGAYAGEEFFEPEEVVSGRWADHLANVPPGWNYKAHTAWAGHPNPTFEAESRFWNFLLKLHPERVSWTVAASPGPWTGPFHWDSRRLRTPEMAAIQGFPEGYRFAGRRRARVKQIGNAVPPKMAAAAVAKVLEAIA